MSFEEYLVMQVYNQSYLQAEAKESSIHGQPGEQFQH